MAHTVAGIDASSLSRKKKLTLIYRHTHPDFKGRAGPRWGKDAGAQTLMVNENGGSMLFLLDDLSDAQIAEHLPYALVQEGKRVAKKAAKERVEP